MATSTIKAPLNNRILKSGWTTSFSFYCPINASFMLISNNRLYVGTNYDDNVTFVLVAGSSSLLSISRDSAKTTITATASSSTYIFGILWY